MPNKYLSKISSPIKASIIYTICNFFIKGLNIITLPIFTRIMTPYELGIVTTFTSWTTLLSVIANLSLNSGSFNIAMLEFKQNREGYQSSVLGLSTISSVMLIILYLIFFEEINQILGLGTWLVILMLISFVFKPAMDFWLLKQRYEYKYKLSSLVSLSTTFCATIFSIFAVLTTRNSEISSYLAEIRLYSSNLIIICVSVFIYVLIFIRGKTFYNKVYWRFALTTSLPLMIHTLAKHILDVSDKLMISNMIGKSATGI